MGLIWDSVCVLLTQSVFFLIGWIFFVKKLFKDYELRHPLVQVFKTFNILCACIFMQGFFFDI